MAVVSGLLLLGCWFFVTGADFDNGLCFSEKCWTIDGVRGCKRISGKKSSSNCCEGSNSAGFIDGTKLKSLQSGCYKCYTCEEILAKVDGKWGPWSSWSKCSVSCGGGAQSRERRCDSPPKSLLGADCVGSGKEELDCNEQPCPIDGGWSPWDPWSPCSTSCGRGTQKRQRECNDPEPDYGGKDCSGSENEVKSCARNPNCPIDGKWSAWSPWSRCSKSCGVGGEKSRTRACNSPRQQHGGKPCTGADSEYEPCNEHQCPIDGGWGPWGSFSSCSATCGRGSQRRRRECNNPIPSYGGKNCVGSKTGSKPCVLIPNCPIDGKWSAWSPWSGCSKTCGGGKKSKKRACDSPRAQYGGNPCMGPNSEYEPCNQQPCAIHGEWTEWSEWGPCVYVDCDEDDKGGRRTRSRSCTNPRPQFGGEMCKGKIFDTAFCIEKENCKLDGEWSAWSSWDCSRNGANRIRTCTEPAPQFGGADCEGADFEFIGLNDLNKFCGECSSECCKEKGKWKICGQTREPVTYPGPPVERTYEPIYEPTDGPSGDGPSGDRPSGDGPGSGYKDQESGEE